MLTTRRFHSIAKAVIWASVILLSKSLVAQEVTITVDGPWAYVADPGSPQKRIIIIAPVAPNHDLAQITPKPSAHDFHIPVGFYNLDFDDFQNCDGTKSSARFYSLTVNDPSLIKQAIASNKKRYAFSLPKPCYYKQVVSNVSKVSDAPITTQASDVVGDIYTTTMELHYMVSKVGAAKLTGTSDGGSIIYNDDVDFKNNNIQFTMSAGLQTSNDETDCDSTSAGSFLATVKLFGAPKYVWFPILNPLGEQIGDPQKGDKGFFLDNCQKDNTRDSLLKNMGIASAGLKDIETIEQYFAHPKRIPQKQVLQALADLTKAVESLKDADQLPQKPGKAPRPNIGVVREELNSAKKLILAATSLDHRSKGPATQDVHQEQTPLTNTYRYVTFSASGSADCHGAQVGVNGP